MLLRNGTLPAMWIPPAELRDQREMREMYWTACRAWEKCSARF
jgi:ribulose bisphosphate carboxylase small subunit